MTQIARALASTLRLRGPAHIDTLDPVAAYHAPAEQITRLFARGLLGYLAEADLRDWRAVAPVPDLATDVPSTYNTGMGARHLNYVVHLRPGAMWDTTPPRQVTAHDVVRGFKRMGNPVRPAAALAYFTSTIRGMRRFCQEYAAATPGQPSAADLAAFTAANEIPGVFALDDDSLVIELERPALDFVNMLALPCAAPAPAEYDAFLPGSAELSRNLVSNGPYRVAGYLPGREFRLERNPAWRQQSDPIRHQLVDAIVVTMTSELTAEIAAEVAAGRADLPWALGLAAGGHDGARSDSAADGGDGVGYELDPYLVINMRGGVPALRDAAVRRALCHAINKAAVADLLEELSPGRPALAAGSVIPPGNAAHQELDYYSTPGHAGDADRCRALLAEAGHPDGLALTLVHLDDEAGGRVARSCALDLEKGGVRVQLAALDFASYRNLLAGRGPGGGRGWDLAVASWRPDWRHGNGRVFVQPMFASGPPGWAGNHGGYASPRVDQLIDQALAHTEDPDRANAAWREAERQALSDAAVIPILFRRPAVPGLRGPRVRGAVELPAAGYAADLSSAWLNPDP